MFSLLLSDNYFYFQSSSENNRYIDMIRISGDTSSGTKLAILPWQYFTRIGKLLQIEIIGFQ